MALLRMARVPPPTVAPGGSVLDAVGVMTRDRVGAIAVVEMGVLKGIFTERDLMLRVVQPKRNPETTLVREVMTSQVKTVVDTSTPEEAINVMLVGHLRHLPILGNDGPGPALHPRALGGQSRRPEPRSQFPGTVHG